MDNQIQRYASGNDLRSIMAFGDALIQSRFLPEAIKTGAQAAAIILTGRELGLPEMQSLRSINIIRGKPCLAADLMLALFLRNGGTVKWHRTDDQQADIELGKTDGTTCRMAFSIAQAKQAGLTGNPTWQKFPAAMLRARVITAACRAFAPDSGFAGIYDPDELENIENNKPTYAEVQPVIHRPDATDGDYRNVPSEPPRPSIDALIKRVHSLTLTTELDSAEAWIEENTNHYSADEVTEIKNAITARRAIITAGDPVPTDEPEPSPEPESEIEPALEPEPEVQDNAALPDNPGEMIRTIRNAPDFATLNAYDVELRGNDRWSVEARKAGHAASCIRRKELVNSAPPPTQETTPEAPQPPEESKLSPPPPALNALSMITAYSRVKTDGEYRDADEMWQGNKVLWGYTPSEIARIEAARDAAVKRIESGHQDDIF